jgi:hypothetical protein
MDCVFNAPPQVKQAGLETITLTIPGAAVTSLLSSSPKGTTSLAALEGFFNKHYKMNLSSFTLVRSGAGEHGGVISTSGHVKPTGDNGIHLLKSIAEYIKTTTDPTAAPVTLSESTNKSISNLKRRPGDSTNPLVQKSVKLRRIYTFDPETFNFCTDCATNEEAKRCVACDLNWGYYKPCCKADCTWESERKKHYKECPGKITEEELARPCPHARMRCPQTQICKECMKRLRERACKDLGIPYEGSKDSKAAKRAKLGKAAGPGAMKHKEDYKRMEQIELDREKAERIAKFNAEKAAKLKKEQDKIDRENAEKMAKFHAEKAEKLKKKQEKKQVKSAAPAATGASTSLNLNLDVSMDLSLDASMIAVSGDKD